MASKTLHTNQITFMDLTDDRKLDAYITSNLPTTQIYDQNNKTYTPDWSKTNLQLTADIYLDSKEVTHNTFTSIIWYKKIGTEPMTPVERDHNSLTINTNELSNDVGTITYICEAIYKDTELNPPIAHAEITFVRVDTGKNGTSINILGSYDTIEALKEAHPTGEAGSTYLVDGDLYVWSVDDSDWVNVGNIQGPEGKPGESAKNIVLNADAQVFKVDKNNAISPATITVTAQAFNTTANGWIYSTNGGQTFLSTTPKGVVRTDNQVVITGADLTSNSLVIKAFNGDLQDTLTVYKVFDGSDGTDGADGTPAPITFLTNENISFSANEKGQIAGMTFTTNVVAYSGTTKVTPAIGTITGLPTGMTVSSPTTLGNELILTFTISNNTTLGSALSNNGTITIPITSPVNTNLKLSWSKVNSGATGAAGVGIKSTTVAYGVSDSASIQPADDTWQPTIPVVEEGKYLWTRTIIDYTDDAVADTVAYTYVKQGTKGDTGSSGSSVTISSIQYQEGASATTAPTGTWSNSVVTASEGKYLWTRTNFSDGKTAYGVAKQGVSGKDGVGINSTTVDYGVSDSATVKPTTWQQDIPVVAEGKYLWTRTITDYTDTTKADTVTYVYAKQGSKGATGTAGTSVTVKSIKYQAGTSATTAPTGTWSDSVVAVAEGSYLWTQTTFSDNKIAYGVAKQGQKGDQGIQGQKGDTGRGISKITEYYLATTASSGVTTSTSGWTTTVQSVTSTNRYLWNYEVVTYTDNTTSSTAPIIIGVFGNTGSAGATGKGIKSITEYYLATNSASGVTTSTSGWTPAMQSLTATKKYLWNYELITYTDNSTATINPVIIGVYGDKGLDGITFQVYSATGYIISNETPTLTLQTFAYDGSTEITSGATYQWSQYVDDIWIDISEATTKTLAITKGDVLKAKSYKCTMTYKSKQYVATVTVQDKTDIYNSIMCISSNETNNNCYWVLYTLVYSDTEEVDPLLGPISATAPTSPVNGDYWYAVDTTNATVTLKKYNGTSWANSTDTQSLSYYWDIINDGSAQVPLGASSKVKVVSCHDFTATATLVCEVSNIEDGLLTQSSLSITDASDPIVSEIEPVATVNGQIWIKPNGNGTYLMFVWDASLNNWISSDMDTRNKVYTSRPSSYNAGDLWITASDADHGSYLHGTLLQAQKSNTTYSASDWSPTLRYDQDIDDMKETLNNLSQYVTITSAGLRIGARNTSGELSPFTSLFTSTELSFYQNSEKLLTLANNQLTAPRIVVEEDLEVQGSISLGDLKIIIESNGSFSFAIQK